MSKIISENQDGWSKKSWLQNFVNDRTIAANLTEEYAHDVLEAVGEEYFPNLDAAIADLSLRTGLTASEVGEIKKVAIAMVTKAHSPEQCECSKKSEIPGNVEVPGEKLVKEGPESLASVKEEVKTAGKVPEQLKPFLFKKKEEKEESKEEKKEEVASVTPDKTAWFQGNSEPTKEGDITANDPAKLGYPKEIVYPHKPMETSAPGGQDSRPAEQKAFEGSAEETKKVMGPKGKEFETKIEMQRIPKGEKPANASSKRLSLIKEIVASESKKN